MKRAERSALVKGMDVVYIYHDTIDEASHTSDTAVFSACDKAISELKNLVRIIVNEFGGTNILITADHGFLYTYSPLTEDDKVGKNEFYDVGKGQYRKSEKESARRCVEYGRRYAIMQKGVQPNYLLPVKFLDGKSDFDGFAPREHTYQDEWRRHELRPWRYQLAGNGCSGDRIPLPPQRFDGV